MDKKYNFLRPIKNQNLIRLGRKADGGYIVDKNIIKKTDGLVSFGMGSDWSFELDYIKINNKVKIFMYDCYVSRKPYIKEILKYLKRFLTFRCGIEDLKKRIFYYKNYLNFLKNKSIIFYSEKITNSKEKDNEADIDKVFSRISKIKKVVFKIDIEGTEFELIDKITEYKSRIAMIIFEFHWLDKNEDIFIKSVQKLKQNFNIIHIHGNNHCQKLKSGLPIALELTFINKDFQKDNGQYVNYFPIKDLDYPNNPHKEDLTFSFVD